MGLRELLTAEKHSEIKPLIQQSFPYVYSTEKTEDCIERLKSYSESSIPVLDSGNHILGVITLESLLEAVDDEMGDDYANSAVCQRRRISMSRFSQALKAYAVAAYTACAGYGGIRSCRRI